MKKIVLDLSVLGLLTGILGFIGCAAFLIISDMRISKTTVGICREKCSEYSI
jgi:hypothetical protein